jgi:hypothetical protein
VKLQIEPPEPLLVKLNNDFNKLKRLPKEVSNVALRLLSRQLQKREQLRSLRLVVRLQLL